MANNEDFDHQTISGLAAPDKRTEIFDGHTKGLGLRITPTGTKTFFYRYRFNGRIRRFTIGRFPGISLSEARKRVLKLKVKVNDGIDPQAEKQKKRQKTEPQTFKELTKEFEEKHLPTLRESTRTEYKRIIDTELIPKLGKYPINEISKNQIISLLDDKAYKDEAPTMANRIRARLSRIYTFGMERGLTDSNPVQTTATYKNGNTKRSRFYDKEEIKELWSFFERFEEPTQSVLKMLLICGQRKTETMKMKWENIREKTWTIPAELAKNKQPHDVPLPDMALKIIEKMKPLSSDSDYVFKSPQKENQSIEWLTRARKHIQRYSDVPDFRPHDLRRTVASHMAELGVNRTVLGKILNHKGLAGDDQVTAIYDRHSYMEERREALDRWNSRLNSIINKVKR